MASKVPPALRKRLVALSVVLAAGTAGVAYSPSLDGPSTAVVIAMELGSYYESSGKHIGTPYIDTVGKGNPLTVCNGMTGKGVVAGRYYTKEDCHKLELPHYQAAERQAAKALTKWQSYNPYIQASFIDMVFNLGPGVLNGTTVVRMANAGDLPGACAQMTRWVNGTVAGKPVKLAGLVDRRGTTAELCAEWGRDGKFGEAPLQ